MATNQTVTQTIETDIKLLHDIYHALGAAYNYVNLHDLSEGVRNMNMNKNPSPLASLLEGLRHELGDILLGEQEEDEPATE